MSRSCCFPVLLLFLCVLPLVLAVSQRCPSAEDVLPCTCHQITYGLHVMCEKVDSSDTLKKTFSVLREYDVYKVVLYDVYLHDPPPQDLFVGMKVKELRIQQSHIQFSEPAFSGLDASLTLLAVDHCSLVRHEREFEIVPLPHLTVLTIQHNRITQVRDGYLRGRVPNVQRLVLENNLIAGLGDEAFADMKQLKEVSLSRNQIEVVSRSMFPRPAMALTSIDFSRNRLHSVPSDIFNDMPSLQEVVLTGNQIQTLPEQTWIDIWGRLNHVQLNENSLVCDEKLQWIKNLKPPTRLEGRCSSPSEMVGKSIKDIFDT